MIDLASKAFFYLILGLLVLDAGFVAAGGFNGLWRIQLPGVVLCTDHDDVWLDAPDEICVPPNRP